MITLRHLTHPTDTHSLQRVLEDAPRYSVNLTGEVQPPHAAEEVFSALPHNNFDSLRKFVFGIAIKSELIGCIDVLRGFPKEDTAMIGLLLLSERHQGQGLGRLAYTSLEQKIQLWPEIRTLRISVIASNAEVLGFWAKMGFTETGVRRPYQNKKVVSESIVLEKSL